MWPLMPPLALISATAISTDVSLASPTVFKAPDFTMLKPMVMSCATAGRSPNVKKQADAVSDVVRRFEIIIISISPKSRQCEE